MVSWASSLDACADIIFNYNPRESILPGIFFFYQLWGNIGIDGLPLECFGSLSTYAKSKRAPQLLESP